MSSEHSKSSHVFQTVAFIFSILCTVAAFWLVSHADAFQTGSINSSRVVVGVLLLALLQLIIQIRSFFRLDTFGDKDHWNLVSLVFTVIVLAIVVGGSLWIMYNLNYNMMDHASSPPIVQASEG